jgi:hypothetical protein
VGFYAECPKISTRPHMQRKPLLRASPQGWTSPRVLWLENLLRKCRSPPGPEDIEDPAGAKGAPTSPSDASLGHDAAHQFTRPKSTEHPEASPQSPKYFRLGAPGGCQLGEGSSVPWSEKQPCQYSRVPESL